MTSTQLASLRRLAEQATPMTRREADFYAACSPTTVLELLDTLAKWEKEIEERGYAFQKAQNATLLENKQLRATLERQRVALKIIHDSLPTESVLRSMAQRALSQGEVG